MADSQKNETGVQDNQTESAAPVFAIITQYIKDLSFENPNAPQSLLPRENPPRIDLNLNISVKSVSEDDREVALKIDARAHVGEDVLFNVELEFAALIRIKNVPDNQVEVLCLVEAPRLIFPFAREIIASVTKNGGFAPVLLDPVDFAGLYTKRLKQQQEEKDTPKAEELN